MMVFSTNGIIVLGHGNEAVGSTPHDQLLVRTSVSFSGLLLFAIGFLLFMVAFVKEREFQVFFAEGCLLLHIAMAIWRAFFESNLEELRSDWLKQVIGDIVLGLSWGSFVVYSWGEKYD
ncbi:uncharacterized protein LOC124939014 [Impatiens glandulifera]|uniref:uncharacterized protein LOC124939014 n=1 Tax=Impatiens glandulifera TaxID=253017 RepID=UPI001FB05A6F|nr:uncharacterized protein LOC124939014 [Impatiens glandulifera]